MLCSKYDVFNMKPRKGSKRTVIEETIEYERRGKTLHKTERVAYYNREDFVPVDNISDCVGHGGVLRFGTRDAYISIETKRLDEFVAKFGDDNLIEIISKNLTI